MGATDKMQSMRLTKLMEESALSSGNAKKTDPSLRLAVKAMLRNYGVTNVTGAYFGRRFNKTSG